MGTGGMPPSLALATVARIRRRTVSAGSHEPDALEALSRLTGAELAISRVKGMRFDHSTAGEPKSGLVRPQDRRGRGAVQRSPTQNSVPCRKTRLRVGPTTLRSSSKLRGFSGRSKRRIGSLSNYAVISNPL
jgi:hypothetical protein